MWSRGTFVLFSVLVSFQAYAACNIRDFFLSDMFPRKTADSSALIFAHEKPHSEWGRSGGVAKMNITFHDLHLRSLDKRLPVFQESIAEKTPELLNLLTDVDRLQASFPAFKQLFKNARGSYPSVSEMKVFFQSRANIFESGVKEYIRIAKPVDFEFSKSAEIAFERERANHRLICAKINASKTEAEISEQVLQMNAVFSGYLNELHAAIVLPKVKKIGARISEMTELSAKVRQKMDFLREEMLYEPDLIDVWAEKYPRLFKKGGIANLNESSARKQLDQIQYFINSKEIDVVREGDGITRWVELKRNAEQFNLEGFAPDEFQKLHSNVGVRFRKERAFNSVKSKSDFDQIMEDQEIIDFLGLSDKIKLEYYASGGMTFEVKNLLESHGVKVISNH